MAEEEITDVLVLVFDINPSWWVAQEPNEEGTLLSRCLESVVVFCNSYLLLKHTNRLAFIVSHPLESKLVYPQPQTEEDATKMADNVRDGKYESFIQLDELVVRDIKELAERCRSPPYVNEKSTFSLLAGALAKALCYCQRMMRSQPLSEKVEAKVLVVKCSPDSSSQYMAVMNCIFAAQKKDVIIDCCSLFCDSGFMQQAADITGGKYLRVDNVNGLLQYLLWVNLPDHSLTQSLSLPSVPVVDYRAACFCHRKLVDTGFVCSVCLSIYCQFRTQCVTCQTRFKLPSLPFVTKGKKKKKD